MRTEHPNPFKPPSAELLPAATGLSASTAISIAFLFGLGLFYLLSVVTGLLTSWLLIAGGTPVQDLYTVMYESPWINLLGLVVSFVSLMVSGAIVACLRQESPYQGAIALGAISMVFVIAQYLVPFDYPTPAWSKLASILSPIPGCPLGAWLWKRRPPARSSPQSP